MKNFVLALLVFPVFGTQALAVVVANPSVTNPANTAPDNGAPWDNVIYTNGAASGIYLGGGWVLTAEHVYDNSAGSPASVVSGGITYFQDPLYGFILNNSAAAVMAGLTAQADLALFRLTSEIPLLPTISLGDPTANMEITMIGFGGGSKAWGSNNVEGSLLEQNFNYTNPADNDFVGFTTDYDTATQTEGQAINGDSGGGAFAFIEGIWQLVGMMNAINTNSSPNQTLFSNMSTYSSQINSIIQTSGAIPEPSTLIFSVLPILLLLRRRR